MTEQQRYEVVREFAHAELRQYARCTVAEVTVTGSAERAGNRAFGSLVRYISAKQLAMTAPVLQVEAEAENEWTVSFVLPGGKSMTEYPLPDDAKVTLRELPDRLVLAARWSGRWSYASVESHADALRRVMGEYGLIDSGPVVWARYDPPWKPWFLRRNEVLIDVTAEPEREDGRG